MQNSAASSDNTRSILSVKRTRVNFVQHLPMQPCDYWHATGCEARPVQEMSNFQPKIQGLFPIHKNITTIQQAERYVITAATVTSFTNDHHIKEQSSKRQCEKKKQGTVMRNELGQVMQVPFFIKTNHCLHTPTQPSLFFFFGFFLFAII